MPDPDKQNPAPPAASQPEPGKEAPSNTGQESVASPGAGNRPAEAAEHGKPLETRGDLNDFNRRLNADPEKNKQFLQQLAEWDKAGNSSGNILRFRRAGLNLDQFKADSLARNALLASAFIKAENESSRNTELTYTIDFKGNKTAENYIGLGDLLPPHVEKVKVYGPDGQIVSGSAIRKVNPTTKRIGYFDEATGAYVAVHSGFKVSVLATRSDNTSAAGPRDTTLERRKLSESVVLFQDEKNYGADYYKKEDDQRGIAAPRPQTAPAALDFSLLPPAEKATTAPAAPEALDFGPPSAGQPNEAGPAAVPPPTGTPGEPPVEPAPGAPNATPPESGQPKNFRDYNPKRLTKVPPGISGKATQILRQNNPIGTVTTFEMDGKTYVARDEVHCHAPTDNVPPNLKQPHHGVTVYEAGNA